MDLYSKSHDGGDTTGPQSAQYVLRDPTEFAVLETASGSIRLDLVSVFVISV
jgi:cyanophycin synthetase